jgi:hypothetical protein
MANFNVVDKKKNTRHRENIKRDGKKSVADFLTLFSRLLWPNNLAGIRQHLQPSCHVLGVKF